MKYFLPSLWLVVAVLFGSEIFGQTTIYSQDFGTGTTAPTGWTTSGTNAQFVTTTASTGYTGASGGTNMSDGGTSASTAAAANPAIITTANISTVGYTSPITLQYAYRISSASYTATIKAEYSVDGGSTWVTYNNAAAGSGLFTVTGATWTLITAQTLTGAAGISNLKLRWTFTRTNTSGNIKIDDIKITGTAASCSVPDDVSSLTGNPGNASAAPAWTNGACFDEMMVVAVQGSTFAAAPTGNGSTYTANTAFGSGTQISTGEYVVYKGTGTTVSVTNLVNGSTYAFKVFTRKGTTWSTGVTVTGVVPFVTKYYWNGGSIAASPAAGGTGTWGTANAWRQPTNTGAQATYTTSTTGLDAVFAGTAGTVTVDANYSSSNFDFQTSGYTLQTGASTMTLTGPVTIVNNGSLTFNINNAGAGTLNLSGSMSGTGTAALNIPVFAATGTANRLNLSSAGASIAVPINITGSATGIVALVATSTGTTITKNIANTSTGVTAFGATSGNDITFSGVLSGTQPLMFAAGSSGGAGTVTLTGANTYSGSTSMNLAATGKVKLGVNNTLPTGTDLIMSASTGNGGILDLNGFDQTVGSLSSGNTANSSTTSQNNITNGATGTGTNTLTISGSAAPSTPMHCIIQDGSTKKIALTRSGTGATVLSGTNTYTGATTVSGGKLIIDGTCTGSTATVSGGYFGGTGSFSGTGTSVTVNAGAAISGGGTYNGRSTGNFSMQALTLNNDAVYQWDINNWSGVAGNASGWDKLTVAGTLTIAATSSNPIVVDIAGLTATNTIGAIPSFSNAANKTFVIASAGTLSGFAANKFSLSTTNLTGANNLGGGVWTIQQNGNNIELVFTAFIASPTISISGAVTAFSTLYSNPSSVQSYTVSGSSLTDDIQIDLQLGGSSPYEIKTSSASIWGNSITLPQSGGIVPATIINVRLKGTTLPLIARDTINHMATAATTQRIPLGGEVMPRLIINEIHYNPNDAGGYTDANYEFLEIYNTESFAVNLNGYSMFGVTQTFGATHNIAANGYLVLAATAGSYPGSVQWTSGSLSNAGELLEILSPAGNTIDSVNYGVSSPWPTAANGSGPSMELNASNLNRNIGSNWHANPCLDNGTPGAANSNVAPALILYSTASGTAATGSIWACSPTGTGRTVATYGGFADSISLVIQSGHIVDFASSTVMKNLTIQNGGQIRRNSSSTASMAYLSIYGTNIINNGIIGNGAAFDAIGFNLEGANVAISGTGVSNIGRIRKSATTNAVTNFTVNTDIDLWFPGAAWYNNAAPTAGNSATLNMTINAGNAVTCHNSADISGDGVASTNATNELYGVIDVYGSLVGVDTLRAFCINTGGTTGLTIRNGGLVTVNTLIDSFGTAANDYKLDLQSGGRLEIADRLNAMKGTLTVPSGATLKFLSTSSTNCAILDNFSSGFTGAVSGSVTAQRFVPLAGTNQHYVSSPLNNTPFADLGVTLSGTDGVPVTPSLNCSEDSLYWSSNYGNVFEWNQSLVSPGICGTRGWVVRSAGNMTNAQGYSVYLTGNQVFELSGTPNQGASYSVANCGNNNWTSISAEGHTTQSGWHLVGNPFLSSINLDATYTGFGQEVQVFNTTGTYKGTYIPMQQGVNAVIAPFQAFMIRNPNNGTFATYTVNRSEQIATGATQFRKNNVNAYEMQVDVAGNGFADYTRIHFNDDATTDFDNDHDAHKFHSVKGQPTLFTTVSNEWVGINTIPVPTAGTVIPMGFEPGNDGSFTMSFAGFQLLPGMVCYLEDKQAHSMTRITDQTMYQFQSAKTDSRDRFALRYSVEMPNGIVNIDPTAPRVYSSKQNLVVEFSENESGTIEAFDLMGRLLFRNTFNGTVFEKEGIEGPCVVVKLTTTNGRTYSNKIILK